MARVIVSGKVLTYDMVPHGAKAAGTSEVTDAVIKRLQED
ncbi:hypothetical protein ACFLXH_05535 [Chloroflexota bacterium]